MKKGIAVINEIQIEKNKINKGLVVKNKLKRKMGEKGITLIALVITILVLLILARSSNSDINRRKWNTKQSTRHKRNKCLC